MSARGLLLALAVLAAVPVSAGTAEARTIDGSASVLNLGGYDPLRSPSIASAIARLGTPSSRRGGDGEACTVRWNRIGLTLLFVNLGGGGACGSLGRAQRAHVAGPRGRAAWVTGRGLRVGDSFARMRRLYPRASRHGRIYWLTSAFSPVVGGRAAILSAYLHGGRVQTLRLWIGAAGD